MDSVRGSENGSCRNGKAGSAQPAHLPFFDQATRHKLIDFTEEVESLDTPEKVLEKLDGIVAAGTFLRMFGAHRFSVKVGDWRRIKIGKNVFLHKDVPKGWVEEWTAFVAHGHPVGLMTARVSLAPFTWTELSRMLDPVGVDRWPFELALKYGMRDGYICPVGGRWAVAFWSPKVLPDTFTHQERALLLMAASAVALRIERLASADPNRVGSRAPLTAREQSVLRHASTGKSLKETAEALGLGEETVRSHIKKAQTKLGTRNKLHTVAEAMRDLLIV